MHTSDKRQWHASMVKITWEINAYFDLHMMNGPNIESHFFSSKIALNIFVLQALDLLPIIT